MKNDFGARHFLGFCVLVLIAAIGLNFIGLQGFEYLQNRDIIVNASSDGHNGWAVKDAPIVKNELGIREPLSAAQIAEIKGRKILFLGTSVVMGGHVPLEDTFAKKTVDDLNERTGSHDFAINGGLDGKEAYREFEWVEAYVDRLKIDEVIWFPHRNDFILNEELEQKRVEQAQAVVHLPGQNQAGEAKLPQPVPPTVPGITAGTTPPAPATPTLINRLANKTIVELFEDVFTFDFYKLIAQRIYFVRSIMQENFPGSSHNHFYTEGIMTPLHPRVIHDMEEAIKHVHGFLQTRGIPIRAVFLPTRDFHRRLQWKNAHAYQDLKEVLDRQSIESVEFLSELEKHRMTELYVDYTHFNVAGHELVAELIANWMEPKLQPVRQHEAAPEKTSNGE
jgi:hypothetical protein